MEKRALTGSDPTENGDVQLPVGQCASLACLLEVNAPKPGNVHRGADFEGLSLNDFVASAVAIGAAMEAAVRSSVGETVLRAIRATRRLVNTNTNLGTVLLIAPLAAVPRDTSLGDGIAVVLSGLGVDDAQNVYEAIRLALPGGLGHVNTCDIGGPAPDDLIVAMRLAADRDMVARQFVTDFADVLQRVVPWLVQDRERGSSLVDSIIHTHVQLMSRFPDSLIARKCGPAIARESSDRAAAVLEAGEPGDEAYFRGLADLDFWLRADHHRRNPGTTADLVAAGLFAALRDGMIRPPFR